MITGQLDEEAVFQVARKIADLAARAAYLDQVYGAHPDLRQRVDALLHVHDQEEEFLKSHPGVASTAEYTPITEGPGTRVGRYKLLQEIGEGGFGVVYMAEQKEPVRRRVALKIVKLGMDTKQVVARFESERQALALMDHPNVAKVLDAGATETRRPYFVMELVKGVPITKYCDDNHLNTHERLELFIPVANAVQHAHLKGIIHRDIKPSNIMVTMHDGVPIPKVIDFGIAKATQQELTEKTLFTEYGQFIGTPAYMSPEQAEMSGLDIDTRTDIYSLGVLLYELLVGHTPIDTHDLMRGGYDEIRRRIKEEEPKKPSTRVSTLEGHEKTSVAKSRGVAAAQLASELKGDLDWIVLKALEKDRTRRYQTATGLAEDIKRHLASEPVLAAAPSTSYRVRKYVRRHRAALAVAATIAALLVAGTIISSVLALREARARVNEAAQRKLAELNAREKDKALQRERKARGAAEELQRKHESLAYASALTLAPSHWDHGSLATLEQTLNATASFPHRGFEWYYWQAQLHQERRTIYPQVGPIWSVRLAADERDILVTTWNRRAYRLDAATGDIRAAYGGWVMSTDGRWLADGQVPGNGTTVIDTATGMRTAVSLPGTEEKIALSPDGRLLLTIDRAAKTSHVWDVRNSTPLYEIKRSLPVAKFSPDGRWLAAHVWRENGPEIELWRASDGEAIHVSERVGGHFLGFTPNSAQLACWDGARQIHLHSTNDLSDVRQVACEREPGAIAFSPDGTYLAIAFANHRDVVINDIETGRVASTYRVLQHSGITFSHDGHELIVCSRDGAVRFFPVESRDYIRIGSRARNPQFSSEGSRLLLMTDDGAQLIDVASRKLLAPYPNVLGAAIFPDGRKIATVPPVNDSDENRSTTITIADDTGKPVHSFEYDDRASYLTVAPDGRHIFVAAMGSCDSLLDAKTGKRTFQANSPDTHAFSFLPDGKRFALAFDGEFQFRIYDAATGSQTDSIPYERDEGLHWVQFSQDGKRLVTSYDNYDQSAHGVSIYDMATKERIQRITGHADVVYAAYFLPDSRRLFTKSRDGTVRLWDVENGFQLLSLPDVGNVEVLPGRALSPNGRMIAIAGPEGVFLKEAATPEQVAAWQKPQDPPADTQWWKRLGGIQDWLVLAPITLGEREDHAGDLDKQQLPDEAELDRRAGDVERVESEKLIWQQVTTSDCVLDFQKVTSYSENHCLAYAVTHIYSDAPREGIRLLVGNDDLAKVYLNGKPIYEFRGDRPAIPADDEVLINLRQGKNVLVCKVIDTTQGWGLSAQIVGDYYQPIPGVTTGTNP